MRNKPVGRGRELRNPARLLQPRQVRDEKWAVRRTSEGEGEVEVARDRRDWFNLGDTLGEADRGSTGSRGLVRCR